MGRQASSPRSEFLFPSTFAALTPAEADLDAARAVLLPVPYDGAASFKGGAREGPAALIAASRHLEDYDVELDAEPSKLGIHTHTELEPSVASPEAMAERVYQTMRPLAEKGKLVGVLGGDHSIAVGPVRALAGQYSDLSVLYLDAHADLRDEYQGSPFSHACTARRIHQFAPLVQVGVRSLSTEERDYARASGLHQVLWEPHPGTLEPGQVVDLLSDHVYVSIDLDVLDPSFMPAVGTPEPNGMTWSEVTGLLRAVAEWRDIVGFDVVELCPREGPASCAYIAAKLVYKLIGYALLA